ncbi:MAG: ferredoxin domain-containing protein, partial [Bacteroidales bacterium]|nr:ferredoxin domain-containing protein [Bacteroidales bacterium]
SQAVILVGSKVKVLGLDCGYCGFASCKEKEDNAPLAPCFFNSNDLGIAIGSMCSKIADHRIDSRVMFSVGLAAKELSMLSECSTVLAIVLSVSSKSVFFDRVVNK